jgi:hypothetical protein
MIFECHLITATCIPIAGDTLRRVESPISMRGSCSTNGRGSDRLGRSAYFNCHGIAILISTATWLPEFGQTIETGSHWMGTWRSLGNCRTEPHPWRWQVVCSAMFLCRRHRASPS